MANTMSRNATPVLLATGNRDKQNALRRLLQGLPLDPITPEEVGISAVPEESGITHEAIARDKAVNWSKAASINTPTDTLAIATDGGLVIPVLGEMWESRYTHRFAGPAADNNERLERLQDLMEPYTGADRQATWVEALAIAHNGRILTSWEVHGGTGGVIAEFRRFQTPAPEFWAFSIWHFPEFGKAYNQLTPVEKSSINDHWTRLGQLVRRYFLSIFVPPQN